MRVREDDARNGMPEFRPYIRGRDEAQREAEVQARVTAAQQHADKLPGATPRCDVCHRPDAECPCYGGS